MSKAKKDMREEAGRERERERKTHSPCKGNDVDACVFLKYTSTQFQHHHQLPSPFPTPWKGARRYISFPFAPSYLTSLRVLTLSIPLLSLSFSLPLPLFLCFSATSRHFQQRAYAPINVPHAHTFRVYVCIPDCAQANTLRSPRLRGRASGRESTSAS